MAQKKWTIYEHPHKNVAVLSASHKNLRSICQLLLGSGILPIPYTDETEFLAEGQSDAYDAIIVDSHLAQTGVGELTQALTAQDNIPPIIVMVNKADINNVVLAIRAGASDVLSLPLSPQQFARHLHEAGMPL